MKIKPIPVELIRKYYEYRDGDLIRKSTGRVVGWGFPKHYLQFDFRGKKYLVHRVIYALHYGDTESIIDHKNRDKFDNRISNLRKSNKSLNGG